MIVLDSLSRLPNSGADSFQSWTEQAQTLFAPQCSFPNDPHLPTSPPPPPLRQAPLQEGKPLSLTLSTPGSHCMPIRKFAEVYLTAIIDKYKCTGYADYCFGYERADQSLFAVIEAKKGTPFSLNSTIAQTLFYMGELWTLQPRVALIIHILGILRVARTRTGIYLSFVPMADH